VPQLGDGVEEYYHLGLALGLGDQLEGFKDDLLFVLFLLFGVEMRDSLESLVLLIGVELYDVVVGEVVLDEPPEVLLVAGGRGDEKLGGGRGTLAIEVLMKGFLRRTVTSLRESSLSWSHSSKTTHFSSERSKLPDCPNFICTFLGRPTMMWPF